MTEPPTEFQRAIAEFNQQEFYACHDTLEAIWIEAPESDRRFYQGLLQIAVACYHLGNGNISGAMMLLGEGINRLGSYPPDYYNINLETLVEESLAVLSHLQTLSVAPNRPANLRSQDLNSDWVKEAQHIALPTIQCIPSA